MSEEEVKENVEETPEVGEQEESDNPIFNALFKAVEGEGDAEEEEQEEFTPPSSLQSALHDIEQDVEPEEQETATEETPEKPTPEEAVPQKKKRVARKKNIVDPDFTPTRSNRPKPPPPPSADLSGLNSHESERYELAKWASNNIEGYEGKDTQYLNFFKKHKQYLENRLKEDPDIDLEGDAEYGRFLQENRPEFNVSQVNNARVQKVAEINAIKKLNPEIQKQKRELARLKAEPQVKAFRAKSKKVIAQAVPEEIMNEFKTNPDFSKTHALEAGIVDRILGDANMMADAFHNIAGDLEDFDPKNPAHVRLSKWIDMEQTAFINSGKTKRNGKVFVRRERFPNVPAADRDKYYTFSDEDMVTLLAKRAGESMRSQIKNSLSHLEKSGFTRATQGEVKAQAPVNQKPRKIPSPSPRPGPSMDSSTSDPEQNKVLSLLGL
jgi:hypothetical protein